MAAQGHMDCSPGQYISQRGWCPSMYARKSKLIHCHYYYILHTTAQEVERVYYAVVTV